MHSSELRYRILVHYTFEAENITASPHWKVRDSTIKLEWSHRSRLNLRAKNNLVTFSISASLMAPQITRQRGSELRLASLEWNITDGLSDERVGGVRDGVRHDEPFIVFYCLAACKFVKRSEWRDVVRSVTYVHGEEDVILNNQASPLERSRNFANLFQDVDKCSFTNSAIQLDTCN